MESVSEKHKDLELSLSEEQWEIIESKLKASYSTPLQNIDLSAEKINIGPHEPGSPRSNLRESINCLCQSLEEVDGSRESDDYKRDFSLEKVEKFIRKKQREIEGELKSMINENVASIKKYLREWLILVASQNKLKELVF